jgi:hypothetical protein
MSLLSLGWEYLPNIITEEKSLKISKQILFSFHRENGNMNSHWDPTRGNVLTWYSPKETSHVMEILKPILENMVGEELLPTYWFCTAYHNGGWMSAHKDREACEISVSMNLSGKSKWPLKLKDFADKRIEVVTPPGNGVAYLGTEVEHWRSPLRSDTNERFIQAFFHFVRKNGKHSECAYEGFQN